MTHRFRSATLVLLGLCTFRVAAQLESPLLSKVQLNLVNPGGKSLAMGGAFVSVADDSTAALANPAGLTQLGSWQVGVSGKTFSFEPRLRTDNFFQDASGAYQTTTQDEYIPKGRTSEVEFASIVGHVTKDLVVAGYRAVNLRYSLDASDLIGGNYRTYSAIATNGSVASIDEQGGLDLQNELYGISLGGRIGPVSIGGGVTFNKLRFDLTGGRNGGAHLFRVNADDPRGSGFDTTVTSSVTSGTRVGFLGGIRADLWQAKRVAVGVVYRKSPTFDMDYRVSAPASGVSFSCGVDSPLVPNSGASACGTFHVPDDFSIGISGMPFPNFFVAIEVQRILYSQLNDGYVPIFVYRAGSGSTATRAVSGASSDDGTLPRVGIEYTIPFSSGSEVNIRAGYFNEPKHGTRIQLYPDTNGDRRADPVAPVTLPPVSQAYQTAFNGGESENHVSFGLGASIARHLSIDLAADLAKTTRVFVLSAFYRF